jgi:RimJ/RimL family protein N-acetyltransferase
MAAINADEQVMQHFPSTQNEEQTKGFMGRQHLLQKERGYCFFAAELRATQEIIGFIGLSYVTLEAAFTPCVEIGWRLHPSTWGKGLATEGAMACINFGFNELGLTEIYSYTTFTNLPSMRVMEKIGMERFTTFKHPGLGDYPEIGECVAYRISRPETT